MSGAENIAIFGMEAGDVMVRRKQGLDATDVIKRSPRLSRAIAAIENGEFSPGEPTASPASRTRCATMIPIWSPPTSIPTTRRSVASMRAGR